MTSAVFIFSLMAIALLLLLEFNLEFFRRAVRCGAWTDRQGMARVETREDCALCITLQALPDLACGVCEMIK